MTQRQLSLRSLRQQAVAISPGGCGGTNHSRSPAL